MTRPFDLLTTSINFWRVFLPAQTPGLSVREEVAIVSADGAPLIARPLPPALRPPDTGAWDKVEYLLYAVGLPLPTDHGKTVAVRNEWPALVAPEHAAKVADAAVVAPALVSAWLECARRSSIDEIDGFPMVAMGVPPAASVGGSALLAPHADRGGPPAIDDFLAVLAAEDGTVPPGATVLGDLWRSANPKWRFNNTDLVVLLAAYPGGRALNSHPPIALGTKRQRDTFPVAKVAGRNACTLLPQAPEKISRELTRVIAHELAHSFGLGDEYQEFREKDPEYDPSDLEFYSNLQFESAVRVGGSGALSSALIKWNWHRIRKATVLEQPIPAGAGGRFTLPVAAGHGFLFEVGDAVLLRARTWGAVLGRTPLRILAREAKVVAPLSASAILVEAAAGAAFQDADFAGFTPGSLIYAPVPAPASVKSPTYPYAEMIAKNVRDYIDTKNLPLTVVPCVPNLDPVTIPILTGVTLKTGFCGLCTTVIVGLYSGGNRYSCGVFHPAGECIMAPATGEEIKTFCPVCRYALVDAINPVLHAAIDADYDRIYPQG